VRIPDRAAKSGSAVSVEDYYRWRKPVIGKLRRQGVIVRMLFRYSVSQKTYYESDGNRFHLSYHNRLLIVVVFFICTL
jgi:hypothetical protein